MTLDEFKNIIAPYLKKGWIAMDKDGRWIWYSCKPECFECYGMWLADVTNDNSSYELGCFEIETDIKWYESLTEVQNSEI